MLPPYLKDQIYPGAKIDLDRVGDMLCAGQYNPVPFRCSVETDICTVEHQTTFMMKASLKYFGLMSMAVPDPVLSVSPLCVCVCEALPTVWVWLVALVVKLAKAELTDPQMPDADPPDPE